MGPSTKTGPGPLNTPLGESILSITLNWTVWECTKPLHSPVTVRVYNPKGVALPAVILSVELPGPVVIITVADAKRPIPDGGRPMKLKVTVPLKP
jgi:hypothetical protein